MWELLALGAVAAGAVFLGFPLALTGKLSPGGRSALTGGTIGVLAFLALDLAMAAWALLRGYAGPWGPRNSMSLLLLAGGFAVGALTLRLWRFWQVRPPLALGTGRSDAARPRARSFSEMTGIRALQLSTVTAAGIGIHNLAEGLALGTTYVSGATTLTVLLAGALIVHKSTEGFCVCGCSSELGKRFSRAQLASLGAVAGTPTFAGTLIGGYLGAMPVISLFVYGLAIGAVTAVIGLVLEGSRPGLSRLQLTSFAALGFGIAYLVGFAVSALGG